MTSTRDLNSGVLWCIISMLLFFVHGCTSQDQRQNVILITIDTLRADHLGAYGYRRDTSPNIDRFAANSMLFEHAYAHAPSTNPSLSSLMTSLYSHETTLVANHYLLPEEVTTLAEILQSNGYRTAAIIGNGLLTRDSGFAQGFDEYDDDMDDSMFAEGERKAPKITTRAIEWLKNHHDEQFFLWIHYMDPHGPYTAPASYGARFTDPVGSESTIVPVNEKLSGQGGIPDYQQLGDHHEVQYYIAQYDGEIRFLDHWLGKLLDSIEELEILDRSMVIITADHGESMGEHDYYFAHRDFVYEGLVHVPLLIRSPDLVPAQIDQPVAQIDIMPTILDRLSIKAPSFLRGHHLLDRPGDLPIYTETFHNGGRFALIDRKLKLIWDTKRYELYDLRKDPNETADLMSSNLSVQLMTLVARLKQQLDAVLAEDKLDLGAPMRRTFSQEFQDKLKGLGYTQ